ncbi:single-stranded DNA-binding protein [Leptolyngbyaceae cyanobacterium CCMR0081]|uniref:Single-stranded DNA-binding protein n=2 Tax=Adonisia TaxID=2950183 RepID=A0A6M0RXR6_9CYAN|nr:single-stranded DNA-binding protein [Adonisia turfae CCMR0081]
MIFNRQQGETIMANNNTVILTGNLGQAPDVFKDKNGKPFVRLSLATTDSYKPEGSDEWQDQDTVWHTCFAYREAARYAKSFKKGERVKILGKIAYQQTETLLEGEKRFFNNATITVRTIKDARLRKKLDTAEAE